MSDKSMTTNQTIDGVPRELLENCASYMEGSASGTVRIWHDRLRALLDAHPCPVQLDGCDGSCAPAAQPKGEPVAWQYRVSAGPQTGWSLWHDGKGEEFKQSYQVETRPLYAEQPAPVAAPKCERCKGWGFRDDPETGIDAGCGTCNGTGKEPID